MKKKIKFDIDVTWKSKRNVANTPIPRIARILVPGKKRIMQKSR